MGVNFNSPWNQSDFRKITCGPHEKPGRLMGLRLPDGTILVNIHENTSEELLKTLERTLSAERVLVKGKWVFVPDEEEV